MATLIDGNLRKCHLSILTQCGLWLNCTFRAHRRGHTGVCVAPQTKKWANAGPIWRLSRLPSLLVAGSVFALWQMGIQKGSQSLEMDQTGGMFHVISYYAICGWSIGITWVKVEVLAPGKFGNIPANTCQRECGTNFQSADQTGALTRRFCCSERCPVTAADSSPGPASA